MNLRNSVYFQIKTPSLVVVNIDLRQIKQYGLEVQTV